MSHRRIVVNGVGLLYAVGAFAWAGCTWNAGGGAADQAHHGFGPVGEHGERRITFLSTPSCGMDAYGSIVVYSSCRGLYLVDIESESEWRLNDAFVRNIGDGDGSFPSIWGNKIAYQADEATGGEVGPVGIAIYDFEKKEGVWLPGEKDKRYPQIQDQKVVWQDHRYQNLYDPDPANRENSEVFLYDLGLGQEKRVTNAANHQVSPDVFGDFIVWRDERDLAQMDVWMYRVSTGEETNISNHPSDQLMPSIWEDKVVWADLRNGTGSANYNYQNLDIYLYDITTGQTQQITDDPSDQEHPNIFGRYITWNDMRNGSRPVGGGTPSGADVYLYDLETSQEKRVTWHDSNDGGARVIGEQIVWYTVRDGEAALYMKPLDAL